MIESAFNSGNLVDQGLDIGAHYRLPATPWGNFRVGVDGTYIEKYNIDQGGFVQHLAGHFDKTFGNFARVRGLATLDWNLGPWTANWTTRYIGRITLGYANAGLGPSARDEPGANARYNPNPKGPVLHYGAVTYHNASLGYNIEPINTFVQVGVDNIFDKQPPLLYLEQRAQRQHRRQHVRLGWPVLSRQRHRQVLRKNSSGLQTARLITARFFSPARGRPDSVYILGLSCTAQNRSMR